MSEMMVGGQQAAEEWRKQLGQLYQLSNPAGDLPPTTRRPRISMSEVQRRLEVPDLPGYRLYWFKDENVPKARDAYYEHVKDWEIAVAHNSIGSGEMVSGNTDLGSNVSIIAGQNDAGQPVRLNLMKLPMQYYKEDQAKVEMRNAAMMEAIFGEEARMFDADNNIVGADPHVYKRKALFNRPQRKIERKKGPLSMNSSLAERVERMERVLAGKNAV